MTADLSDEQAQLLMDRIVAICEEMELGPEQILDGLGRVLISATDAFEKSDVSVKIDGFGECNVKLDVNRD